jgi:hypothetical protein
MSGVLLVTLQESFHFISSCVITCHINKKQHYVTRALLDSCTAIKLYCLMISLFFHREENSKALKPFFLPLLVPSHCV